MAASYDAKSKERAFGHMAAVFTILLWGTTFISTKVLLRDLSPIEILSFSFGVFCPVARMPQSVPFEASER